MRNSMVFCIACIFIFMYPNCSWSEDAKNTDIIITSSLQTAPPGYTLEKTFGNYVLYDSSPSSLGPFMQNDMYKLIQTADKKLREAVKKTGGNAILGERISVNFSTIPNQTIIHVIIEGEAVFIKPIK